MQLPLPTGTEQLAIRRDWDAMSDAGRKLVTSRVWPVFSQERSLVVAMRDKRLVARSPSLSPSPASRRDLLAALTVISPED
jgi:hypothetical protein